MEKLKQTRDERQSVLFSLSGALFCLNGPAALVGQKDSTGPSLVAACSLSGLPWAVHSRSPGQQDASRTKRGGKALENRESSQKNQRGTVAEAWTAIVFFYTCTYCTDRHKSKAWFGLNLTFLCWMFSHLRMKSSKSDLRQVHRPKEKEQKTKSEGKLQPIRNILQKVRNIS